MPSINHDEIIKMFNRISPTYDLANRLLSFGLDSRWRRSVASHLPSNAHLHVLDLATGTGEQIAALFQMKVPIEKAIGIDLAEEMLKIAKKKFSSFGQVEFIQGDVQELPFDDQSFDAITFSFGIRNVANPMAALAEMHRVMKPCGHCLILEFALPRSYQRPIYLLYLRYLAPFLGKIISSDASAYRYLNKTIESFASPDQFLSWMSQTGWKNISATALCFGSVMLYQGDAE